jgi:hypothetical protein
VSLAQISLVLCAIVALPAPVLRAQSQSADWNSNVASLSLSEEQQTLLARTREYALDYVANLPNFTCRQITHQFEAGRKPEHWHKLDSLSSRLVFSGGKEERTLEMINDKPIQAGHFLRRPLQTEGEFGVLLGNIFGNNTQAVFTWNGWQTLRGKRTAVFGYLVDRQHSTLRLTLSNGARAVVPYHGSVYADPATGAVWRIDDSAFDIPLALQTRSVSTIVDYDSVDIAGQLHLLPVEASVALDTGTKNVLNRMEFRDYRKFEAESKITFAASNP